MGKGIKRKIVDFGFEGELKEKLIKGIDQKEKLAKEKKAAKTQAKLELEEAKKEMNLYNEGVTQKTSLFSKLKKLFTSKSVDEENNDGKEWFYDEEGISYSCIRTTIDNVLDNQMKKFSKKLSGQEFLERDLQASPLFIEEENNYMKVIDIKVVYPEKYNEKKAYILFETKFEYYIIAFDVTIIF